MPTGDTPLDDAIYSCPEPNYRPAYRTIDVAVSCADYTDIRETLIKDMRNSGGSDDYRLMGNRPDITCSR